MSAFPPRRPGATRRATTSRARGGARRAARGMLAVEMAYGFLIMTIVLAAMFHFGDAMVVRNRLTLAVSRGARVCAPRGPDDIVDCAEQQARAAMGPLLLGGTPRCEPMNVVTDTDVVDGVPIVTVSATCRFTGGFAQIVRRFAPGTAIMVLRSQATMPLAP